MNGRTIDEAVIIMSETDNVATAIDDLTEGRELTIGNFFGVDNKMITLVENVPFGHKIALTHIEPGGPIYKYGEVIGEASGQIEPGEWVHTHNCESRRGRGDIQIEDGG
jgi:hypothetical protein